MVSEEARSSRHRLGLLKKKGGPKMMAGLPMSDTKLGGGGPFSLGEWGRGKSVHKKGKPDITRDCSVRKKGISERNQKQ